MVNIGKRSMGCFTCRKRRVKCDERKPSCFRCEKTSNVCEGYPDPTDLLFRNENKTARKNAALSCCLKLEKANEYDDSVQLQSSRRIVNSARGMKKRGTVTGIPTFSPTNELGSPQNIDQLVLYHLFSVTDVSRNCMLRITRDLRQIAAPGSALVPLTKSLAWLNAPSEFRSGDHLIRARQNYTEAITKLRKTLREPASSSANETLLVISLVSMIEVSTSIKSVEKAGLMDLKLVLGDLSSMDLMTFGHLRGALSFIQSRQLSSSFSGFFAPILTILMNNMILGCLNGSTESASQLLSKLKLLYQTSVSALPSGSARILHLGISAVDVHNEVRIQELTGWFGTSRGQTTILLEKCNATLREISEWSYLWESNSYSSPLFTAGSVWSRSEVPENISMWFRKDWAQLCLYQLLLHVAARRCIHHLSLTIDVSTGNPEKELRFHKHIDSQAVAALDSIAREIIDFVPIFLGTDNKGKADRVLPSIAAYAMLTPLRVAKTVPGLGMEARTDLTKALGLIATHAGISSDFITNRIPITVFD